MHGAADTITQIVTGYDSIGIYWRSGNPTQTGGTGVWNSWRKLWHEGNDGAGSGLEADAFAMSGKEIIKVGMSFNIKEDNTIVFDWKSSEI
jgi:hypothetical protein